MVKINKFLTAAFLMCGGMIATAQAASVTINFVGANGLSDAWKCVSMMTEDEDEVPVTGANYEFVYEDMAEVAIIAEEGYIINIVCDDADLTNEYKTGDYFLEDQSKQMRMEPGTFWDFAVYPGADGATFTATVTKVGGETANTATLKFVGADGLADPWKYVSMMTEDEDDIPITGANYEFVYEDEAEVAIIAEEGYIINIVCDDADLTNELKTGDYFLEDQSRQMRMEPGTFWDLVVYPGANGATFTATVTKTASEPEYSATITFVGANGLENAYQYITIEDAETEEAIPVTGSTLTLSYDEEMEVLIMAEEGYTVEIVCNDKSLKNDYSEGDYYLEDLNRYYEELTPNTQWDLAVFEGADGATFTATVTKLEGTGVASLMETETGVTVYNMLGVKVLESSNNDAARGLTPGLYIINGKKVIVK